MTHGVVVIIKINNDFFFIIFTTLNPYINIYILPLFQAHNVRVCRRDNNKSLPELLLTI